MTSHGRTPLRWRRRALEPGAAADLEILRSGAAGPEAIPSAITPEAAIELPELPDHPTALGKAVRLLQAAAAIEHALMVQYLYAGSAFSGQDPAQASRYRDIIGIAVEEMAHLMTVQNLLKLLGAEPELSRQDFGPVESDEDRLFPFDLLLEPVTHESLAKYVVAESPENVPSGVDPALLARIIAIATQANTSPVNRVGTLYALLGAVFGSEALLAQKAAGGDPWYVMVNSLAATAAVAYGGRDRLHLPDSAFHPASVATQGSDRDWDRSVLKALDEFRIHVVGGREAALEAIRDIGLQGEGPSATTTEEAHFVRFLNLFKAFYGADGAGTGLAPSAAAVPRAAIITVDDQSTDPEAISHPDSARWAKLANQRYAILLGSLELYLRQPAGDRAFLLGWCFAEMFAIRFLSGALTRKPRSTQNDPRVAAVPFTLPSWTGRMVFWDDVETVLKETGPQITAILATGTVSDDEKRVLSHLGIADARKLAEAQARKSGTTASSKLDRTRDILDWLAGAANPPHPGSSPSFHDQNQGRFWNVALSDFTQTEVFGANIVTPVFPGATPPLVNLLKTGSMPPDRAPLRPNDAEMLFIEKWVNDNCPDEPV